MIRIILQADARDDRTTPTSNLRLKSPLSIIELTAKAPETSQEQATVCLLLFIFRPSFRPWGYGVNALTASRLVVSALGDGLTYIVRGKNPDHKSL
jgi:hypothetical protein